MGKRTDAVGIVLLLVLIGAAGGAAYGALALEWFRSPWEMAGVLVALAAFVAAGIGVQVHRHPKNDSIYGTAQPATEAEAQAAARGTMKSPPLHDRTFPD